MIKERIIFIEFFNFFEYEKTHDVTSLTLSSIFDSVHNRNTFVSFQVFGWGGIV